MIAAHREDTYRWSEAIRSGYVRLKAELYLVKLLVAVSNETSTPTDSSLLPNTPERLTIGLGFSPTLALTPANSWRYWSSSCQGRKIEIKFPIAVITILQIRSLSKRSGKKIIPSLTSGLEQPS